MISNIVYKEMVSRPNEFWYGSSIDLIEQMISNIVCKEMVSLQYEFLGGS